MAGIRTRQYRSYKEELEELQRRLEEDCRRLQEMLRRREEEMKKWEDEMRKFIEEELVRQRHQREAEQWQFIFEAFAPSGQNSQGRKVNMAEAWNNYQNNWHKLPSVTSGLTFRTIPWPMAIPPAIPESLRSQAISSFILSQEHSQVEPRRRRILAALRRWHTDHFDTKVLHKVVENDKAAVKEGVGRVVRCLNDMLAAESYCKSDIF